MDGPAEQAFEDWYAAEHSRVLATLVLVTGEVDLATEATDEAFARALLHWNRVRAMTSPGGWVLRVGLNVARRAARRSRRERELLARVRLADVVDPPVVEAWDLVRALPRRQREAVVLRYVADLPEGEIGRIMGVRRGTVSSTLADARRHLAEQWDVPQRRASDVT
jgi:RNA polymerase sigma-70 factor (ECF subfamily)